MISMTIGTLWPIMFEFGTLFQLPFSIPSLGLHSNVFQF